MSVNEILAKFSAVASNPAAQKDKYLAAGKKVVLVAPVYTPEEIIDSMGMVPMGAWGGDCELQEAKKYFPAFICSVMQSIVELGMKGAYEGASAIVIPSLCDSLKVVGQNFKKAVPSIPFIPMTYPQNRTLDCGAAFCKAGYERVIADLEAATGAKFEDAKLAESIAVYNKHNAAMRKLAAVMAKHPEVSAVSRSDVYKSAFFMTKAEHTALVEELTAALEAAAPAAAKTPVYVSGILADSPALNQIFDDYGLQIVADDVAAQSRQYRTDAPAAATAMDSLVVKFQNTNNDSLLYDPAKKRIQYIVDEAVAAGAKGFVVLLTKFCDPEEFDYPLIKKACDAANLPIALIEIDRQMVNYEQAKTILETFKDVLNG